MALFVPGEIYRRRELHAQHGGSWQNGISTSAEQPIIFLFTGSSGERHGYRDGPQSDGTFWYTGEGQSGDMTLTRGNLAIVEADAKGKELHLFEDAGAGLVRYVGRATYLDHHNTLAPDTSGAERTAIVFELALDSDAAAGSPPAPDLRVRPQKIDSGLSRLSTEDLRALAADTTKPPKEPKEGKRVVRERSEAVRLYVFRRANGVCEGCAQPAPFRRQRDGTPYLEPHHMRRLADGGPDHPASVAAICPNCHRRVHSGEDGDVFNRELAQRIAALEAR